MPSVFTDKAQRPTAEDVAAALGKAHPRWQALRESVQEAHGPLTEEWYFAGKSHGWAFRLKDPKRTIVYMTPGRDHFVASLVLGERACAIAAGTPLPDAVRAAIADAPKYVEGRGIRVTVRRAGDVTAVRTLVAIKVSATTGVSRRPAVTTRPRRRSSNGPARS